MVKVVKATIIDAPHRPGVGGPCAISTAMTAGIQPSGTATSSAAATATRSAACGASISPTARNCASSFSPCRMPAWRSPIACSIPRCRCSTTWRPCPPVAGHRRRPHLLALGVHVRHAGRARMARCANWCGEQIYQAGFEAIREQPGPAATRGRRLMAHHGQDLCNGGRSSGRSSPTDRAARFMGGGTLVMRGVNEADARCRRSSSARDRRHEADRGRVASASASAPPSP